jgi:hypothetical protein
MAADLAGVLVLIGVTFGGNLATSTFSIGGEDARTYSASGIGSKAAGRQFGLDGHSRCEGDASATRAEYVFRFLFPLSPLPSFRPAPSLPLPPYVPYKRMLTSAVVTASS